MYAYHDHVYTCTCTCMNTQYHAAWIYTHIPYMYANSLTNIYAHAYKCTNTNMYTQIMVCTHTHTQTNYRPPSWLGTNIPLSPNVYNSDPSQPLMNSKYDISKVSLTEPSLHHMHGSSFTLCTYCTPAEGSEIQSVCRKYQQVS